MHKLLVVDDEIDFLTVLKIRLEANQYDVLTAFDGEEALKKIRDEHPDVVLLDVMLPRMDGLSVLKTIRQENQKLPVFIITAFSNKDICPPPTADFQPKSAN